MMKKMTVFAGVLAVFMAWNAAAQAPALVAPAQATIPAGPKGVAITQGRKLLTETHLRLPRNVGNGLNCSSCHLAGGTTANASPWIGIWGVFPEYRSRSGKVISLQERVNDCFVRSMIGKPLA